MKRKAMYGRGAFIVPLFLALASPGPVSAADLAHWVTSPTRGAKNEARDRYRHPLEVLTFFGVTETGTVIEILPGGAGYWTEILAPFLKDKGHYIAANSPDAGASAETLKDNQAFAAKIAADPADYAHVAVVDFEPEKTPLGPPGSADFVLTFRNIHNWMASGTVDKTFQAFYAVLKPGGILGIEEHRGRTDAPQDPKAKSGYVRQDYAIRLAEAAGFKFVAGSEVNANPSDTKDYPAGVWTLPPTFRLKEVDRAKYAAIGESDRFILKFIKP